MGEEFTKHMNLAEPDENAINRFEDYNTDMDKIEQGYQILAIAGEPIAQFAAVRFNNSDGKIYNALDTNEVLGIAKIAATTGATIYVGTWGVLTNPAWTWTTGDVYVSHSVGGALTQTPTAVRIGKALSATEVLVLTLGRSSSGAYTVLDAIGKVLSVSNTLEQTVLMYSVPGNTIFAHGRLRFRGEVQLNGAVMFTLRVYFGGFLWVSDVISPGGNEAYHVDMEIFNEGLTNLNGIWYRRDSGTPTSSTPPYIPATVSEIEALLQDQAIDTTMTQTFQVTIQMSVAAAWAWLNGILEVEAHS